MNYPLLPIFVALALSISLAAFWGALPLVAVTLTAILLQLTIIILLSINRSWFSKRKSLFLLAQLPVFLCLGYGRYQLSSYEPFLPDSNRFELKIVEPLSHNKYSAEIVRYKDSTGWHDLNRHTSATNKVILKLYQPDSMACGQHILATAELREPSTALNPQQFDYKQYLSRRHIYSILYLDPEDYIPLNTRTHSLRSIAYNCQQHLASLLTHSKLSDSQRGIAEALLLGKRDEVSAETQAQFRNAGISHLLCVSGLHVGIVVALLGALLFFLGKAGLGRWIKGILMLSGIWSFVLLTGMAPSTLRAGVMFSFLTLGKLLFAKSSGINSVSASAILLLCVNPQLLFDVGFQLSFSAVYGIIWLCPPMESLVLHFNIHNRLLFHVMDKSWKLFCVTTAAQVATLPLVLHYFHQFPTYFLLANLTIIPVSGVILATGFLIFALSWWRLAAQWLSTLLSLELGGVEALTRWVSHLPHSQIDNIAFPTSMALLLGATILLLIALLYQKRKKPYAILLGPTVVVMVCVSCVRHIQHNHQHQVIFYATSRHTAIELMEGRTSRLYIAASPEECPIAELDYARRNHIIDLGIRTTTTYYLDTMSHGLTLGGKNLFLLDRTNCKPISDAGDQLLISERFDYLVVSETPWLTPLELQQRFQFDTLVISANNSPRYRHLWHKQCHSANIPYLDLSDGCKVWQIQ